MTDLETDASPAINPLRARDLTDRIKVAVEGTWQLIKEAYTTRAWAALGYDTWDDYCTKEFGAARLKLPREERQEVVGSLRDAGLSTRAIAAATGMNQSTVSRDLNAGDANASPDTTVGTDGKEYSARGYEPTQHRTSLDVDEYWDDGPEADDATFEVDEPIASPKPKRRPLPEAFADATRDLARAAERLARLTEDDRFPKNREATHHQFPELLGALDNTTHLIQAMRLDQTTASEEARRWWSASLNKASDALCDAANSI